MNIQSVIYNTPKRFIISEQVFWIPHFISEKGRGNFFNRLKDFCSLIEGKGISLSVQKVRQVSFDPTKFILLGFMKKTSIRCVNPTNKYFRISWYR